MHATPALAPAAAAPTVAVVGGGPAGLMAAETLAGAGLQVDVFDAMPSVGRKFLLAGKGGLNLTHAEPAERFVTRYGDRQPQVQRWLQGFGPAELRAWAQALGVDTFVGSSGRVFPRDLKAAPLLRAWLHRLRQQGVRFHMRHRCVGVAREPGDADGDAERPLLRFDTPAGALAHRADAVLLALGGASWPRLGSTGAWVDWLQPLGVGIAPLQPSNCGFDVARVGGDGSLLPGWTEFFRSRHAGAPLKNVAIACTGLDGRAVRQAGECVVTDGGVEGSLVYALSALLRERIKAEGRALIQLDLLPAHTADHVLAEVARPRGSRSWSTHLKSRLALDGVKAALLHELLPKAVLTEPAALARAIQALPLTLTAARPVEEAISSAGGVRFDAMDEGLMLQALPGVFCAGEMLDWEAPTGGYLLTACLASGVAAARAVVARVDAMRLSET